MPLELSPFVVRRELAELRARDPGSADDVEGALEWVCGEVGTDPAVLTRYDLQVFLWYQLPRKWSTSVEHKRAVTDAFAQFLERVDRRAGAHAAVCRSDETLELLTLWEDDEDRAPDRFLALMEASGLEPPDTELLTWGGIMGPEEADLRHQAALALERAMEEGALTPGARNVKQQQDETLNAFLSEPRAGLDGRMPIEVIEAERTDRWLERGSPERRALLEPVAPLLRSVPDAPAPVVEAALEPLVWLLRSASDGIGLTQTGALNRAFVREAVERYPDWWRPHLGPPNREDDVIALAELDALVRDRRLVRRRAGRLLLTRRGSELLANPRDLLASAADGAFAVSGFLAAVQELSAAVLIAGREASTSSLEERVRRAIEADGWRAGEQALDKHDIAWATWDLIRPALALGLLRDEGEWPGQRLIVTEAGRAAMCGALRRRAAAPTTEL